MTIDSRLRVAFAVFVTFGPALLAHAQTATAPRPDTPAPPATADRYAFCVSAKTTDGKIFVSPVVVTSAKIKNNDPAQIAPFTSFLARNHNYKPQDGYQGSLTCFAPFATKADAESARASEIAKRSVDKNAIVETEWTGAP